jgi:hypothetical protein
MLVWLFGAAVILGRAVFSHLFFVWCRRGHQEVTDSALNERVGVLARQLGLRRTVRLIESPHLAGPVAFGVLRPVVGLPPRFGAEHRPEQQDVMLAHELAHLAASDPAWYRLADLAAGLWWWHPAVWWARRQLHAASEVAADEASLLVANGPGVLAECLVALGARLLPSRAAGGMGIEGSGYRSSLGRRVHRLVNLGGRAWSPPGRGAVTLAKTLGPVMLVLTLVVGAGWAFPDTSNKGATMKHWQQALGILTLATTLGTEQTVLSAEPPAKVTTKPDPRIPIATQPVSTPSAGVKSSFGSHGFATAALRPPEGKGAQALREKLERMTLTEVIYDALPLNAVVEDLIRKSIEIDPEGKGINFLFGQERPPAAPPTVDPATGLPVVAPPAEDFDLRSVTIVIRPPLKNLRLVDVLDAIVKVADMPIQYSLGEYAVVFNRGSAQGGPNLPPSHQVYSSPAAPVQAAALQTRTFKLNTNTFFASIERMFKQKIHPGSEEVGIWLQRDVFPKAGARLASPDALVLYNDLTGILLVRGSVEELDAVQSAVETFGGARVSPAGAAVKPSGSSSFLRHLAEGPHTHLQRAVTGVFDALGNLAPPPFNTSSR